MSIRLRTPSWLCSEHVLNECTCSMEYLLQCWYTHTSRWSEASGGACVTILANFSTQNRRGGGDSSNATPVTTTTSGSEYTGVGYEKFSH